MVVGHTKFQPDRLFASIAQTFYTRDVFCIEMLRAIAQQHSTSYVFKSDQIMQWRSVLEEKYSALPGITNLHGFIALKDSVSVLHYRNKCYAGAYTTTSLKKSHTTSVGQCNPSSHEQNPSKLTDEKLRQLVEQHDWYIKADVDGYVRPSFLTTQESQNSASQITIATANKQKRCCSLCNGKGHV